MKVRSVMHYLGLRDPDAQVMLRLDVKGSADSGAGYPLLWIEGEDIISLCAYRNSSPTPDERIVARLNAARAALHGATIELDACAGQLDEIERQYLA